MKRSNSPIRHLIIVALVTMFAALAHAENAWEEHEATLVGRVSHLEGALSRYDTDQEDWVTTSQDAPIMSGDRLQSAPDAKVEVILPNNIWIRMDGDTEIQVMKMDNGTTEIDISFGTTRLYNKNSTTQIKTITPFGHVITPAGAAADLYVYDDGVEITALKYQVNFVHISSNRQHEIQAGAASIFADTRQVSADRGDGAPEWRKWNEQMDALWAMRTQTKGESTTYLPPALHHDAYALDTHGRWERVYYQGAYYRFWRPVHVHAGWTPFSSGVWRVRWGDHVWIPHEPFGYVTHHYGNWVFSANHWYWAPPVTRVMIRAGLPLFHIGFSWYPGRVAWLHTSAHIGWFPLAPYEPYYSHRHWGRRSIVVARGAHLRHKRHTYRHRRHATVIHRTHLYRGKNYRDARVRTISRAAIDHKFRTAPVLNKAVVKNQRVTRDNKRFNGKSNLRRPQPSHIKKNRPNRWTKRNTTQEQLLGSNSTSKTGISSAIKDRRAHTKQLRGPRSVKPREQVQSRERQKVRSKDRRPERTQARINEKIRQPRSSQAQFGTKSKPNPVTNRISKPKIDRRQKISWQHKRAKAVRNVPQKETPQRDFRRTTAPRQKAELQYRRTPQAENSRPPRAQSKGHVQNRTTHFQNQGQANQTRRYVTQYRQTSRPSANSAGGRRASRSGR